MIILKNSVYPDSEAAENLCFQGNSFMLGKEGSYRVCKLRPRLRKFGATWGGNGCKGA